MKAEEAQKLLKEFRYDNPTDANMRLKGTLIRYRGQAAYVTSINDNLYLTLELLYKKALSHDYIFVHSSDIDVDISSPPLGWANFENTPLYLMRTAKNSQKQGINPSSMMFFSPLRGSRSMGRFSFNAHSELYSIGDCIDGDFPSFEKATTSGNGAAFDRDWAVFNPRPRHQSRFYSVYHKTVCVGVYDKKTGRFLFRLGRLTKTRRASLTEILYNPLTNPEGKTYAFVEQK